MFSYGSLKRFSHSSGDRSQERCPAESGREGSLTTGSFLPPMVALSGEGPPSLPSFQPTAQDPLKETGQYQQHRAQHALASPFQLNVRLHSLPGYLVFISQCSLTQRFLRELLLLHSQGIVWWGADVIPSSRLRLKVLAHTPPWWWVRDGHRKLYGWRAGEESLAAISPLVQDSN